MTRLTPLLALLLALPTLSGCASLHLRECGVELAVGAGAGALVGIFGADEVLGDSVSTAGRAGAATVGAAAGGTVGYALCMRAFRQREAFEARFAQLQAQLPPPVAATDTTGALEGAPAPQPPRATVVANRAIRLELGGALLFAPGGDDLAPHARPYLDAIAAELAADPRSTIAVVGHTDDVGAADANLSLSERRARTVAAYLAARGVAPDRLQADGRGEGEPVADNATPDGRARNRRVEVWVLPTA